MWIQILEKKLFSALESIIITHLCNNYLNFYHCIVCVHINSVAFNWKEYRLIFF